MQENHKPIVYYICRFGHWDVVKIGTTINLPARLRRYERTKPHIDWHIVGIEESNEEHFVLEGRRHSQFKSSLLQGEWFWVTPDLKQHMSSLDSDLIEVYLP